MMMPSCIHFFRKQLSVNVEGLDRKAIHEPKRNKDFFVKF